jgi:hypothetical protein
MGKKSCFLRQNGQKSADNKGKFRGYQVLGIKNNPRIVKTANSKPANSEGRLYFGSQKIKQWTLHNKSQEMWYISNYQSFPQTAKHFVPYASVQPHEFGVKGRCTLQISAAVLAPQG